MMVRLNNELWYLNGEVHGSANLPSMMPESRGRYKIYDFQGF